MISDSLGDRMKAYENVTRSLLGRKTYSILRLDGKAFHTYTRGLAKPFDGGLVRSIDSAILTLVQEIQGASLVYAQSDEISVLFTDLQNENSDLWFGGNVQKIVSVAASVFTSAFNRERINFKPAYFDCRVFQLPSRDEVNNYFRWRNLDCFRNAVSAIASTLYSDRDLHGKSTADRIQMISDAGYYMLPDDYRNLYGGVSFKDEYGLWVQKPAWCFVKDEGRLFGKF